MTERKVDLVIGARNNASAALDKINKALDELNLAQGAAASGAGEFASALDRAQNMVQRQGRAANQAQRAYGEIGAAVDKARSSFSRQASDLEAQEQRLKDLQQQARAAAAEVERLRSADTLSPEAQGRLEAAEKSYRDLTREVQRLSKRTVEGRQNLERSSTELNRLEASASAAEFAMRRLNKTQREVAEARIRANQTANASAQRGFGALGQAEAGIAQRQREEAKAAAIRVEQERRLAAAMAETEAAGRRLARAEAERDRLAGEAGLRQAFRQTQRQAEASRAAEQPVRRLGLALREVGRAAVGLDARLRGTAQATRGLRGAMRTFYGDSRRALSLMQRLRGEVLSLTASFVGFYGIFEAGRSITQSFSQLEAATNRLNAAFDSDQTQVTGELSRLRAEADRLGISFDTLSDNYSKFTISAQAAGIEAGEIRNVFTQVSEAGRVLKLSNDQIAGTFTALTQIAGKGTLQMEELRQQLGDRIPGAVGLLAQELGYTSENLDEFYKAVENGQVGAREALIGFGNALENTYGEQVPAALDSLQAKIGRLQNLLFERRLTAGNAGFIAGLETALAALNEFLASEDGIEFFEALGAAFGNLFELLPGVIDNLDKIVFVLKALAAIKIAQFIRSLATSFAALWVSVTKTRAAMLRFDLAMTRLSPGYVAAIRSTTRMGTALRGLRRALAVTAGAVRGLLAAFGGIVGIAVTGLSFLAFEWALGAATDVDELNKVLQDHEEIMGQVAAAHVDAAGDVEKFSRAIKELSGSQLDATRINLVAQRDRLRAGARDTGAFVRRRNGARGDFNRLSPSRTLRDAATTQESQRALRDLTRLVEANRRGEASTEQLVEAIEAFRMTLGDSADEARLALAEYDKIVRTQADIEDRIDQTDQALEAHNGTLEDAADLMRELGGATSDSAEMLADSTDEWVRFNNELDKLKESIPGLDAQLKAMEGINQLARDFQDALTAARDLPDAIQRIAAEQEAMQQFEVGLGRRTASLPTSGNIVDRIIGVESNGVSNAQNPNSTARGLGQFIESTWLRMMRQYAPDMIDGMTRSQILALRDDPRLNRLMVERLVEENADFLARNALPVNDATLYLAHFAGQGGARDVLNASPDTPLTSLFSQDAIEANQSVLGGGRDAQDLLEWAARKMDMDERTLRINQQVGEVRREQAEEAEEEAQNRRDAVADLEEYLSGLRRELELRNKSRTEREIAEAIAERENELAEVGLSLTAQQRAEIEKNIRAKNAERDAQEEINRKIEEGESLLENVRMLQAERDNLIERREFAEGQGDTSLAAQTSAEIEDIESRLRSAIDAAREFWEALGGSEAASRLQTLDFAAERLDRVEKNIVLTGQQANKMIAQGAASAFDRFAQRVANGEDAMVALKEEFLRFAAEFLMQIARMIIQQAILNAISGGMGGGGGIGGTVASAVNAVVAHGGGVAGQSTGHSRALNPAIFANAVRYHGGGIAGIRPDEVPAVLQKGEEVLTRNDPRHRDNGGGETPVNVKVVNAVDGSDALNQALSSEEGERVLLNWMRNNGRAVKGAIG